jgi:hypothetical protein
MRRTILFSLLLGVMASSGFSQSGVDTKQENPYDRFAYLSWRSVPRGVYISRVKARLSGIDWAIS